MKVYDLKQFCFIKGVPKMSLFRNTNFSAPRPKSSSQNSIIMALKTLWMYTKKVRLIDILISTSLSWLTFDSY